ncbi:MAG TPA: hypothetical protein ENK65_02745, partial [Helicobacteraceae bacterium]|nr:hypothetical protein [Helicobacteraceae bacterium]
MKHLLTLLIFLLFSTHLYADTTVIMTDRETQSLLKESRIYFDQENLDFEAIKEKPFHSFHQEQINRAFDAMTVVWVYLELKNSEAFSVERVLEIDNPLIETITLYESYQTRLAGMLKIQKDQHHLRPSFLLQWQAGEVKKVWIRLKNENTALQFGIHLKTLDKMYHDDYTNQYTITIFLGIILAFLTYALFLFFYTRDTSYLFYAFYLSTLIFQQMTYVGFLPLHAPEWFTKIDSQIVVPKVGIMIIAAVWFAQSFLKTKAFPILHKVYNGITLVILIQMPLVGTSWFY